MRLLNFGSTFHDPVDLCGDGVVLRFPRMEDFSQWSTLRLSSRAFLEPWEPAWDDTDYSLLSYRKRVKRYQAELTSGKSVTYFIHIDNGSRLAGGLTLSNIRRGVTQSCTLGYWMGEPHAGKGIMKAAVNTVISQVFDVLHLHRIEAAAVDGNDRSIALLKKCGFQFEGKARQYLKINNVWQDHLLFALISSDPRP